MRDWTIIRERYLRDGLPTRLGGLSANLSRIRSFAAHEDGRDAVESLLEESKFFIEWTGADAECEAAGELVALQVQLARWQHNWGRIWSNREQRQEVAEHATVWSKRVLEVSRLLTGTR